jgi:hypothetical protein
LDFSHNEFEEIPVETGNLELLQELGFLKKNYYF